MKKYIALLLALLLLAGCSRKPANRPADPTTPGATTPERTTPAPEISALLKQGQPVLGQANLLRIPCPEIEAMGYTQLYQIGQSLVFCDFTFDEAFENITYSVVSVNGADGSVQARLTLPCSGYTTAYAKGDKLVFVDSFFGDIQIYNEKLEKLSGHTLEGDELASDWQLSRDVSHLYKIDWEQGMTAVDLATGQETALLTGVAELMLLNWDGDDMILSYIDRAAQRQRLARFSTLTHQLQLLEPPVFGTWYKICGDTVFANAYGQWFRYNLASGGSAGYFYEQEGAVTLLDDGRLLISDPANNGLMLYDAKGNFLSACVLEGEHTCDYVTPQWCDAWGGYLIPVSTEEQETRLYFWDTSIKVSGQELALLPYSDAAPGGYIAQPALYRRAEELSETYGVDIRIADQCQLDYDEYYSYQVYEQAQLTYALDQLEMALRQYPQGFFSQLLYGQLESIRIEFVGGLQKKNLIEDAAYTSFSAFAQEQGDHYLVVVDVDYAYTDTYYHEFSHIIDKRLEYDASLRPEALYSGSAWMDLQPKGFGYSYSYDYLPDDVGSSRYDGWFVDYYACTFPTEDRARIMEYAMAQIYWPFEGDTPIDDKLAYYSRCIRDCFDTTGWPEKTAWEQAIDQ
ncbi:MAG: lipoprotein [Oscillospiraceae bacterium]|nr:lipoprotein [Oscillospiraceae bacterium]